MQRCVVLHPGNTAVTVQLAVGDVAAGATETVRAMATRWLVDLQSDKVLHGDNDLMGKPAEGTYIHTPASREGGM